jgi:hypothetical protein
MRPDKIRSVLARFLFAWGIIGALLYFIEPSFSERPHMIILSVVFMLIGSCCGWEN